MIGVNVGLKPAQVVKQEKAKLKSFPLAVNLVESNEGEICFCDEAVFSVGQTFARTWMAKG